MALAMSRPWKNPKTGIYWFRKRVPDELRDRLGKTEEKQSGLLPVLWTVS